MSAYRSARALLFGVLLLPVGLYAGQASRGQGVEVRVNGRALAPGLIVPAAAGREEVFVSVAGLARAIDGAAPQGQPRLRVAGPALYAAAEGGCPGCPVRVRRPVLISPRLRTIGTEPYLPLSDLVRAFEGKLSADRAAGVYTIFAGSCHWCVLEAGGE